ncbi:MAG: HD domain-containing protein [Candidatus Omnitrophica bacterium]|nr:HD domain-containing protein [Candidatus Omnitrophota bacterium]
MPNLAEYPALLILQKLARQKKLDVFLVGGFLRDAVLNKRSHDFDFVVPKNAIVFSRLFAKEIKGAFVLLDKKRGCGRVAKKYHDRIETYDFADFRAATLKADLNHRDFTVNTLTLKINDLDTNEDLVKKIHDACGGIADLKARCLRMVSAKTFIEDPLRLLRAYSLRAQLGFRIEPKTRARIKKDKDLLSPVARERILDELFKVLQSSRAAENLTAMDKVGLLEKIIPQISLMYRVTQGGYHHLDVWPHSLETVNQLEKVFIEYAQDSDVVEYLNESLAGGRTRRGLLKLAALLHDIGKPQTRKKEKGRMSFHSHEHVGKGISRAVAMVLLLSTRERMILENVVLWHLRPGYLSNFKKPSDRAIFRYFRDTKEEAASIALLSIADQRSTRGPLSTKIDEKHHEKICSSLIKQFFAAKKEKPFVALINGHDLIRRLKLKPSPLFGKILQQVEEAQATGKVTNKAQALQLARKIWEQ